MQGNVLIDRSEDRWYYVEVYKKGSHVLKEMYERTADVGAAHINLAEAFAQIAEADAEMVTLKPYLKSERGVMMSTRFNRIKSVPKLGHKDHARITLPELYVYIRPRKQKYVCFGRRTKGMYKRVDADYLRTRVMKKDGNIPIVLYKKKV